MLLKKCCCAEAYVCQDAQNGAQIQDTGRQVLSKKQAFNNKAEPQNQNQMQKYQRTKTKTKQNKYNQKTKYKPGMM